MGGSSRAWLSSRWLPSESTPCSSGGGCWRWRTGWPSATQMPVPAESGNDPLPPVRKGQGDVKLSRQEFVRRLGERSYDPAFDAMRPEILRVLEVAWTAYDDPKSPNCRWMKHENKGLPAGVGPGSLRLIARGAVGGSRRSRP